MTTASEFVTTRPGPVEFVQQLCPTTRRRAGVASTTVGEPTATPGLLIAPRMASHHSTGTWQFCGDWRVVHQDSGRTVPPAVSGMSLGHARDVAALLGESGLAWAQPLQALPSAARQTCLELLASVEDALDMAAPLRTRPSSWQQHPPLYSLFDTFPAGYSFAEEYQFLTFEDAAEFVVDCQQTRLTVFRDEHPAWALRCAWLDCQAPLVDGEYELPLRGADRPALTEQAQMQDWRQLDERRWLCPACSCLFTPAAPTY